MSSIITKFKQQKVKENNGKKAKNEELSNFGP
jgi:hypothetical protein